MTRHALLHDLSHFIRQIKQPHPTRVAIDGIDNAGKTMFADELAAVLKEDRPIIRASIDGFHQSRSLRYKRGILSPSGYYLDSFDNEALVELLLKPLGPNGDLNYVNAIFDFRADSPLPHKRHSAIRDAILIFDGVFLLRPELNTHWDLRVFLQVSFEISMERALLRDRPLFGSVRETKKRYAKRYLPGQQMYLDTVHPELKADIVIDNTNPATPLLLKGHWGQA